MLFPLARHYRVWRSMANPRAVSESIDLRKRSVRPGGLLISQSCLSVAHSDMKKESLGVIFSTCGFSWTNESPIIGEI